jgi:TetR/AcrR family transcriptional regulator
MQRKNKNAPEMNRAAEEKLMWAAKNAFIKYGLEGARMQDIANEAGISKSMLHYYFSSKEKLFEQIFRQAVSDIFSKLREILDSDESVMGKINRLAGEYIDFLLEHPYLPLFVLHESHKDPMAFKNDFLAPHDMTFTNRFVSQITEEVQSGQIRAVNPHILIQQIMGMCVFPIVAQPVLQTLMNVDDKEYIQLLKEAQLEIPIFFERVLKK